MEMERNLNELQLLSTHYFPFSDNFICILTILLENILVNVPVNGSLRIVVKWTIYRQSGKIDLIKVFRIF